MAWRPYENLEYGILDNRTAGKVTGFIKFLGMDKPCRIDLEGDFHEDIRGCLIELRNEKPEDRNGNFKPQREGSYMEGFDLEQKGKTGDMTFGLEVTVTKGMWERFNDKAKEKYPVGSMVTPYVDYPYLEWYSKGNGRVVLELVPAQVKVIERKVMMNSRISPDTRKLMMDFLTGLCEKKGAKVGAVVNG